MNSNSALTRILGPEQSHQSSVSIRAICASTINGSSTISGRSKSLGNELDGQLLNALRDWCDVVLVGAETVRSENYFGVQPTPKKSSPARMAVVTSSMEFFWDKQFFYNYYSPHIFLVPNDSIEKPENKSKIIRLQEHGDVVNTAGGDIIDCITALTRMGFKRILCEGGPSVFGGLIAADAVDQLYLTLDPTLTSAVESPVTRDASETIATQRMQLESVEQCPDSTLFLRYGRRSR